MAETAPVAAESVPLSEGAGKKKRQPKKAAGGAKKSPKPSGPKVSELILKAVSASKDRSGVSYTALKKALAAGGYDVEKNNTRVKLAVKGLVSQETLIQVKGSGASGSFKLNKKQLESKGKAAKKSVQPKKPAAKKVAKSPKKPKKALSAAKSPKKVKKPTAAAAKSPKKAAKSPAKKAAKATKSTAKKAAKPKVTKKAVKTKTTKGPAKKAAAKK
ncbi:histone H1.01-like [Mixophyes fleayi]|uniref:histone H1.01-like n=1 Tax=Mixophyes fleayi TaxID=3061075 RepID=UPI003F4DD8A9